MFNQARPESSSMAKMTRTKMPRTMMQPGNTHVFHMIMLSFTWPVLFGESSLALALVIELWHQARQSQTETNRQCQWVLINDNDKGNWTSSRQSTNGGEHPAIFWFHSLDNLGRHKLVPEVWSNQTCKFMKYSIQISDPVGKLEKYKPSIKIRTALSGHLPYSWKKRCWMVSSMLWSLRISSLGESNEQQL